jgi:electron transport complex protein RnfD
MQRRFVVSSSPHLRDEAVSTRGLMTDVVIAMLPAAIASVWFFGGNALMLMVVAVVSAVAAEWFFQKHNKQKVTVSDMSAVVTGMLLAFNLPASAPWWLAMVGSVLAIVLVKQIFGGIGNNFVNPALAARTILMLSWTSLMAANVLPHAGQWMAPATADAVASATPLGASPAAYTLWQLFAGDVPGMLGETSKMALLLGGVYLIARRVVDWRIPVSFVVTAFVLFLIQTGVVYSPESGQSNALYQLLSGSLILGAFFMATDYVTSPITPVGRIIMGVGCATILFVIRVFNPAYPEGCSFAILLMNVATPLIDKLTVPKVFGQQPAKAGKEV